MIWYSLTFPTACSYARSKIKLSPDSTEKHKTKRRAQYSALPSGRSNWGAAFITQHPKHPTCPALPACSHQQCSLSPCCLELHKEPFSLTLSQLQYAVLFSQKCRSAIVLLLGAQVGYQVNWTQVAAIYLQEAAPAPLPRAAYWHILSSSTLSSSQAYHAGLKGNPISSHCCISVPVRKYTTTALCKTSVNQVPSPSTRASIRTLSSWSQKNVHNRMKYKRLAFLTSSERNDARFARRTISQ